MAVQNTPAGCLDLAKSTPAGWKILTLPDDTEKKRGQYSTMIYTTTNLGHNPVKICQAAAQFTYTLVRICMNRLNASTKHQRNRCEY